MQIILRTHGGLGNQIFQILYGRLFSELLDSDLVEKHELRYKKKFARSTELEKSSLFQSSHLIDIISSLRIPKVLERFLFLENKYVTIFGNIYLDGYFQIYDDYLIFDSDKITRELQKIKKELKIKNAILEKKLVHIRLGDFYKSQQSARESAKKEVMNLQNNSMIITNDEELICEPEIMNLILERNCELISTREKSAEETLRILASYKYIESNNSTLAFWAAVLGNSEITFSDKKLEKTKNLFLSLLYRS